MQNSMLVWWNAASRETARTVSCKQVVGGLYLGICYAAALLFLASTAQLGGVLILGAFLAGGILRVPDTFLYSYPLLLSAFVYRITLESDEASNFSRSRFIPLLYILLLTPLGLLPLIKGTLFPISGAIAVLSFVLLWRRQRLILALSSLFVPFIATAVFWRCSGQPISGLQYYILNMIPIISGYSEAMASPGN